MKQILVTGGAGSIGSELVRQLYKDNNVYILDNNETAYFDLAEELNLRGRVGDVRDRDTVFEVVNEIRPQIIYHAAALKHVTPSMQTPREYVQTNIIGTLNVLEAAKEYKVDKVVNISSDKAVQTGNVMGWTKRGTELFTQIYGGVSVRFGNVLGSRGSVIPIWQKQLEEKKPLTITDPRMERYFMSIEEAVGLVIHAAEVASAGDVYILDMTKRRVNVLDLAKRIINESGQHDAEIKIIGARPGEALSEELLTEEERRRVQKEGNFFVLKGTRSGILEAEALKRQGA